MTFRLKICGLKALAATLFLSLTAFAQPNEQKYLKEDKSAFAFDLIGQMFEHCSAVESMVCEVKKRERYDGEYLDARSYIKMSCEPYCVYLKQLEPSEGVEILYRESWNNGKVLVNPNGFPWINISLDPYGSLIRSNQHHLISDIGFSKFNRVLAHLLEKYEDESQNLVSYGGKKKINDRECHVVNINNAHFRLINYTTSPGETTTSIADKFKISEYRIVELNNSVSGYGSVKSGQVLTIPNDYAPKIRLYIDDERYIPMRFEVYDDEGALFEAYEYENVTINPKFDQHELTKDNPEYGF